MGFDRPESLDFKEIHIKMLLNADWQYTNIEHGAWMFDSYKNDKIKKEAEELGKLIKQAEKNEKITEADSLKKEIAKVKEIETKDFEILTNPNVSVVVVNIPRTLRASFANELF